MHLREWPISYAREHNCPQTRLNEVGSKEFYEGLMYALPFSRYYRNHFFTLLYAW